MTDKPEVQALVEIEQTVGGRWAIRELSEIGWRSIATCYEKADAERIISALESLRSTNTSELSVLREHFEASEARRKLVWYKDGRNNAEREAAEDRYDKAIDAVRALPPAATNTEWVSVPRDTLREVIAAFEENLEDEMHLSVAEKQGESVEEWLTAANASFQRLSDVINAVKSLAAAPHLTDKP